MVTLKELRQYVQSQLIQEVDVMSLANRQINRVGIVVYKNGTMTSLIAVSMDIVNHEGVPTPQVMGLSQAIHEYDGNYRLHRLYADSAAISVVLLAASLEYWKRVFADHSVSPAAQQVIKRYFDQNKGNLALVEPDADSYGRRSAPDFLKAAYLGPVGFNLAQAIETGEKAIAKAVVGSEFERDDVLDMIKDTANNGFDRAYNDVTKTRHSLEDLYNASAAEDLLSELVKAIQKGGDAKTKALTWLASCEKEVVELLDAEHPNPKAWANIVQPALDKLNYGA